KSLVTCAAESLDPDTLTDCRAQHIDWLAKDPIQRNLGGPYYSCVFAETCATECGSHTDWRCVRNYGWLKAPSSTRKVQLALRLTDPDLKPASKVHVKVCRPDDLGCAMPSFEGDTDDEGNIKVELP